MRPDLAPLNLLFFSMSFAASGRGMVRRVPRPLAAKDIEKKVNLTELSQDAKKFFFDLIFNILML